MAFSHYAARSQPSALSLTQARSFSLVLFAWMARSKSTALSHRPARSTTMVLSIRMARSRFLVLSGMRARSAALVLSVWKAGWRERGAWTDRAPAFAARGDHGLRCQLGVPGRDLSTGKIKSGQRVDAVRRPDATCRHKKGRPVWSWTARTTARHLAGNRALNRNIVHLSVFGNTLRKSWSGSMAPQLRGACDCVAFRPSMNQNLRGVSPAWRANPRHPSVGRNGYGPAPNLAETLRRISR
jgi:hypothetical protein